MSSKSHLLKELYNALKGPCGEKCAIATYESLLREVRELGHVLYPQKIEEILKEEREHYAIILKMIEEVEASMQPTIEAQISASSGQSQSKWVEEATRKWGQAWNQYDDALLLQLPDEELTKIQSQYLNEFIKKYERFIMERRGEKDWWELLTRRLKAVLTPSGGSQSASSSLETEETSDEVERAGNFSCKDLEGLIESREIIVFFKPDDPEGRYMEEEVFPMIVEKLTIPWFTVTQSEVKGDEDCKKLFLKYHTGLVTWMYPLVVGLDRGNVSFKFKPTYDLDRDIKDLLSKISAMG